MKTTYDTTCPGGHRVRIIARTYDPITGRFETLVQGKVVGWGFATADDAIARGIEAIAEHAFNDQDEYALTHEHC